MEQLRNLSIIWPGVGFNPTDKQLISNFLVSKAGGEDFNHDAIPQLDIYKYEPWQLQGVCFFFLILDICV